MNDIPKNISQYCEPYLNHNTDNPAKRYTTSTFLAYTLRGKAKQWSGRYQRSLENSLTRLNKLGLIEQQESVTGKDAWVWVK